MPTLFYITMWIVGWTLILKRNIFGFRCWFHCLLCDHEQVSKSLYVKFVLCKKGANKRQLIKLW